MATPDSPSADLARVVSELLNDLAAVVLPGYKLAPARWPRVSELVDQILTQLAALPETARADALVSLLLRELPPLGAALVPGRSPAELTTAVRPIATRILGDISRG